MELSQALGAIKLLISQGKLEEAYEQLVQLLDGHARYSGLADTARINQADFYQLKAQTIKGIISPEDASLKSNQLADKALQIVRQLESGKTGFEPEIKPGSSKAWRYYLIGGVATLMIGFLIWFLFIREEECPSFSKEAEMRVMILPFKQTGARRQAKPEFDIMDGLNDLIDKTPGLRVKAIADVNEHYDIDKDYPNSAQAVEIARNCDAHMLVWGKVNQVSGKDYTVDVRYRLLDAGGVRYAGDTTISRLLTVTETAGWTDDVKAITRLLYLVLANQMQAPIAANVLASLQPAPADEPLTSAAEKVDTSTSFVLADYYIQKKEEDKAIAEYDKILSYDPNNPTALTKRGALLMKKEDYSGAARDLEAASSTNAKTIPALHDVRIKAFLKTGQTEKAKQEVEAARKEGIQDNTWIDTKSAEIQDSTMVLKERFEKLEKMAAKRPGDLNLQVRIAAASLGLGNEEKALQTAKKVLDRDPKNEKAVEVAAEAHLQKGDTAKAVNVLKQAERAGANLKTPRLEPIRQRILPEKQ